MSVFVLASHELLSILVRMAVFAPPSEGQGGPRYDPGGGTLMGITTVRRRDFMRAVLAQAQARGDVVAPWRGLGLGVEQYFDDDADLLVELHREWLRVLVARLHRGEVVAQRTVANVRDLYDEVCRDHPTLRRILDAHETNPALWEPTSREHAMLARIAGLVPEGMTTEDAGDLGRALVSRRIPVQRGAFA